ncbi:alpha/beta hydrolase [Skermanella mucosa]|uniref:alpha/beta hydrolase n=1 Tax=Skermanella mucosa TaxID=1789672 RepID=UPI00192BD4CE|nr:alpha/beta hydrolase [Skermanella mucosa]UEM20534.1 alpha/beta hydrolase [Skermanella mucosa]
MKNRSKSPLLLGAAAILALGACQQLSNAGTAVSNDPAAAAQGAPTLAAADADMQSVLLALQALGPKPIETLSAEEARRQPTMADAVAKVLADDGRSAAPETMASVRDVSIPGPGGAQPARIYVPGSARSPLPVIVYYHGGGWVIADLDTYDASARALANQAGAIVVSAGYRKGPESKFPTAHEDALAAYRWTQVNAGQFGGDPDRIAVAGESAGGSMAIGVSRMAREQGLQPPVHQVLIYPVAGNDIETESYREQANAKPLNKAMMAWFFDKYLRSPRDGNNPLINVVDAPDLAGLPPTTIVTAELDPLRSEGELLARRLRNAGVEVASNSYEGVTHEFFGAAPVVEKAKEAQSYVAGRLREAFVGGSAGSGS